MVNGREAAIEDRNFCSRLYTACPKVVTVKGINIQFFTFSVFLVENIMTRCMTLNTGLCMFSHIHSVGRDT